MMTANNSGIIHIQFFRQVFSLSMIFRDNTYEKHQPSHRLSYSLKAHPEF